MAQQNIHYFPGHMSKALEKMRGFVKSVDLIVEVVDGRAPLSSQNPLLAEIAGNKPILLLLSKSDYADPKITDAWVRYFEANQIPAVAGNLKKDRFLSLLSSAAEPLVAKKREKEARFGMKPQPIRVMIVGIPNVGKSTLINNLANKKKTKVGNKAGVTRAEQWIKLNQDFVVLDTPGILPMNYPDAKQAIRLAILGSMREEVLPTLDLSIALLGYLKENYPSALSDRFGMEDISEMDSATILQGIASKRGLLDGANPSEEKAAYALIKEFKDGILGRFSLEEPDA
ncbi:MAG: ribosome biogenesis GTPase YlqF [Candidatus Enteromonas sp.]|nr:ribosome biogenesis GTPase YlqF [Candidatus Enteromonas sp.]MDY6094220.1 ribosome biogenesis GTPase YlqF [Candidatus Enteromonas sp.]